MSKYFVGRPDGLGNRLEEIIILEAMCRKYSYEVDYAWNNDNGRDDRRYDILLEARRVNIISTKLDKEAELKLDSVHEFTQEDFLKASSAITPKFDINFENYIKPIGVHIRGTDRISAQWEGNHFMKDIQEFNLFLSKAIEVINNEKPSHLFVCADDEVVKKKFLSFIDSKITIVEPQYDIESVPSEYADLFALSLCSRIYMVSKFSTYSILASLIGQIPIVSFTLDEDTKNRYKALFVYDLEAVTKRLRVIKEVSKFKKLIGRVKRRLLR